jgi:hypothetical protein
VIGISAGRPAICCPPTTFKLRAQDCVRKLPLAWFAASLLIQHTAILAAALSAFAAGSSRLVAGAFWRIVSSAQLATEPGLRAADSSDQLARFWP